MNALENIQRCKTKIIYNSRLRHLSKSLTRDVPQNLNNTNIKYRSLKKKTLFRYLIYNIFSHLLIVKIKINTNVAVMNIS